MRLGLGELADDQTAFAVLHALLDMPVYEKLRAGRTLDETATLLASVAIPWFTARADQGVTRPTR